MKHPPLRRKIGLGTSRKPVRARSGRSGSRTLTEAQKRFHAHLRGLPCQCGCGRPGECTHHILAPAPGKVGRRDHFFCVRLAHHCHNLGTKSVHLLGSEAAFAREHGIDLVAVAVENLRKWNEGCGRERTAN